MYTLKDLSKFGGCHMRLRELWQFLGVSLGESTVKTEHNLKNIPKCDNNDLTNNFAENLHMYFKQ